MFQMVVEVSSLEAHSGLLSMVQMVVEVRNLAAWDCIMLVDYFILFNFEVTNPVCSSGFKAMSLSGCWFAK
jgi:hypothetical protein